MKVEVCVENIKVTARDLKIGDLCYFRNQLILKHYDGYVSLDNPNETWGAYFDEVVVERVLPGTIIKITVK